MTLSFDDALRTVLREIADRRQLPASELVALDAAAGRVLAEDVRADRDQPPFNRSTRDGYAVRSVDFAGGEKQVALDVIGEVAAGQRFEGTVGAGQAVEIMTGAPVPEGADAVVMVEHTETATVAGARRVSIRRPGAAGENVVLRGSEARAGDAVIAAGKRLDPAAVGLLASVGCARPRVYAQPRVAIVSTGDELVGLDQTPSPTQIRNSNGHSLAAQVRRAGGRPIVCPVARDKPDVLASILTDALEQADVLLVSGGVSAGKHDHVEPVLSSLGARVVFDGVNIRPGRPLVFGWARDKPFFGLPGNPLSTLVTFDLFVRPALDLCGGVKEAGLRLTLARLTADLNQKALPLLVFAPALCEGSDGTGVRPLVSHGSGDLVAMSRAEALVLVEPGTTTLKAGDVVRVLRR